MSSDRRIILTLTICIFILALLPRILLAFYYVNTPTRNTDGYEDLSKGLLEGRGFSINGKPTSFHEPLYPVFLSAIYRFFGYSFTAVRIIQGIIGAMTCAVIFLISRRLFELRIAILASLLTCFSPDLVKVSLQTMSENLFSFVFVVSILLLIRQLYRPDTKNLILLGVALGLSTMARSLVFFFPFLLLLILGRQMIPRDSSVKKYIINIAIFISFFLLPILPWTVRNWHVHHRFVPIVTKTGNGLYSSYVPKEGKLYGFSVSDPVMQRSELFSSEVDQSNFLIKETLKYIKNNPLRVLKLELLKTAYFWSPFDWEIIGNGVYNFMYGFILPFFIYGALITSKRIRELLPLYLPIIYTFFVILLTYGSPRYRLPFEPYMVIIASAGILHFITVFSKRIYGISLTLAFLCFNIILYLNSYQVKSVTKFLLEGIHLW